MDKSIKSLILSVVLTIIIVAISVPLWNYNGMKKGALLANNYGDLEISVNIGKFADLIVIEENRAFDNITPTIISLRNQNDTKRQFEVLFLVNKKSTISYKDLYVSLGDNIYDLNKVVMLEDSENYYFVLESHSLDAYKEEELETRIWIDDDIEKLSDDSSLTTNFITRTI